MPESNQTPQTILFADIANSTRLYEQLGDERARALILLCLGLLEARTTAKQGRVIKTIGDEIMSTFGLPDLAVSAAVLMQEDIAGNKELAQHHIQLRIGLHHGPVIEANKDIFGDAVNTAARMVALAKGGQIITNALTRDLLAGPYKTTARLVDQTRVRGKQSPIDIYELAWGHPEELTMMTTFSGKIAGAPTDRATSMALINQERQFIVNQEQPVITMGRDATNHIVVIDPKVSRLHARIEVRRDKFILIDQSTNGTYLLKEDGPTILLRRDEIALPLQGTIGLGDRALSSSILMVQFRRL